MQLHVLIVALQFTPTIIKRPAHHAQLETTFNSDTAHSKPYIIINSGQQILPDDPPFNIYNIFPAKIIQNNIFASIYQNHTSLTRLIVAGPQSPANNIISRHTAQGSYQESGTLTLWSLNNVTIKTKCSR